MESGALGREEEVERGLSLLPVGHRAVSYVSLEECWEEGSLENQSRGAVEGGVSVYIVV